jgi:AAA+ ATPase superfamily predicted ATPase
MSMSGLKANFVASHLAYVYEDICREKMWRLNVEQKFPVCFDKVGRWWNNQSEIDIVAYDSAGQDIVFGECKYTNGPMDTDIFNALMEKKMAIAWKNETRREWFIFFSINGYTKQMRTLADGRNDMLLCE